jgi:hypothetical protein
MSEPDRAAAEARFDPLVLDTDLDAHALYRDMRSACPVAHSERFGGFWVCVEFEEHLAWPE